MSILFADDRSIEEGVLGTVYDEAKHPRGRGGRWVEALGRIATLHKELGGHQGVQNRLERGQLHAGDVTRIRSFAAKAKTKPPRGMEAQPQKAAELEQLAREVGAHMRDNNLMVMRPTAGAHDASRVPESVRSEGRKYGMSDSQIAQDYERYGKIAAHRKRPAEQQRGGQHPGARFVNPSPSLHPAMAFRPGDRVQHRDGSQGKVTGEMTNGRVPVKFDDGSRDPNHVFSIKPEDLESLEKPKAKGSKMSRRSGHGLLTEAEEGHRKLKCPKCDRVQSATNDKCVNCGHDLTDARKAKFANEALVDAVVEAVAVAFNPALHPRGRGGKFREILGKLHELSPGHTRQFGGHIVTRGYGEEEHVFALQHGPDLVHRGSAEEVADKLAPARTPKATEPKGSQQVILHDRPTGSILSGQRTEPATFSEGDRVVLKDGREGTIRSKSFVREGEEPTYHVHTTPPPLTDAMREKHAAAFDAWNSGEAYLDNAGNYRIRSFNSSTGQVAPWNKTVKADYPDNFAFHAAAKLAKGGWESRPEHYTEQVKHSDLGYTPEELASRRADIEKRLEKGQAASGKTVDLLKAFQSMRLPQTPRVGTSSSNPHGVPRDWIVEQGYGEMKNPAMRNPAEGAEVAFMPGHELHGKTGTVISPAIAERGSGRTVLGVRVGGVTHVVSNQDVFDSNLEPHLVLKPGVDVESMLYHYLVGHPPRTKYGPGSAGHAQWTYGLPKKEGGTGPVKASEKEALLRKIAQAVAAYEAGDEVECERLIEAACEIRQISGPLFEEDELVEAGVAVAMLARGGARAGRSLLFDPAKHPRGRGGRWIEVLNKLRMHGYHSLGHGVSIEGGPPGHTKVRDKNNRVMQFSSDIQAAKHAVSLYENEARRASGPMAFLRRTPGEAHTEMWERAAPSSDGVVTLHSTHAMSVAAHTLRSHGQEIEARHVEQVGEIRTDNLTDEHLSRVERALAQRGHHTSASFLHREVAARQERDQGYRTPTHEELNAKLHERSPLYSRARAATSKAQALVDAGLADDLTDARAQLRDMGETGGMAMPGDRGEDLSVYNVDQLRSARLHAQRRGDREMAGVLGREINSRLASKRGVRGPGENTILRMPGGERRNPDGPLGANARGTHFLFPAHADSPDLYRIEGRDEGGRVVATKVVAGTTHKFNPTEENYRRGEQAATTFLRRTPGDSRERMQSGELPMIGEKPTPEQQQNIDRIHSEIQARHARGTEVSYSPFMHAYTAYEPVGKDRVRVTAYWPGGTPIGQGRTYTHAEARQTYRGEGAAPLERVISFQQGSRSRQTPPLYAPSTGGGGGLAPGFGKTALQPDEVLSGRREPPLFDVGHGGGSGLLGLGPERMRPEHMRRMTPGGERIGHSGAPVWSGGRMDGIDRVLSQHQAHEIEGHLVDVQTANAIKTVHDALSPERKRKFEMMPLPKMADTAWKLVTPSRPFERRAPGGERDVASDAGYALGVSDQHPFHEAFHDIVGGKAVYWGGPGEWRYNSRAGMDKMAQKTPWSDEVLAEYGDTPGGMTQLRQEANDYIRGAGVLGHAPESRPEPEPGPEPKPTARKRKGSYYRLYVGSEKTEHVVQASSPAKALKQLAAIAGHEISSQDGRYGKNAEGVSLSALTEPWSRRKLDPYERKTRPGAPRGRGPAGLA